MNFDSKSPDEELRPAISRFQQVAKMHNDYFFFFFSGFFALAAGFAAAFAAGGCAVADFAAAAGAGFPVVGEGALPTIFPACFFSLPFGSFGLGCSLIPES